MKTQQLKRRVGTCFLLSAICTVSLFGQVVKINFGDGVYEGWNTVPGKVEGTILSPVYDVDGSDTGYSLSITKGFVNNTNGNGPVESNTVLDMPREISRDNFYGQSGAHELCEFEISGLSSEKLYTFTFFASRMGSSDNRETLYTVVGTETKSGMMNTSNNDSEVVVVADIKPEETGKISVSVEAGPNNDNGSKFFYLGAMQIESVEIPTGLSSLNPDRKIALYPNPVSDILHIDGAGDLTAVEVADLSGKILMRIPVAGSSVSVDLTGLYKGFYAVRLITGSNRVENYKIVKQ